MTQLQQLFERIVLLRALYPRRGEADQPTEMTVDAAIEWAEQLARQALAGAELPLLEPVAAVEA